ncbi:MAG: aminotransferase class I/II-fold pyridoxal phosphate-dependent enzyme [Clostridia bacterium]|nr:aminotransferase class I/II-fold pyridoxal phosphate-dependent enzyme [Clostridia bacterium]
MDYQKLLNPTVLDLKPSGIRRFFDIAAEVEDVISLTIGEPDFSTPWHIRQAGIETLEKGKTWYSANAGMIGLRESVSRYCERHFSLRYDPINEVVITIGGSEAIDMTLRAVLRPGDEVLIPEPCFVCYAPLATLMGATPVSVETKAEDGFRLTAKGLREAITKHTRALIFPFPSNPTGAVMRREHLEEIAAVLRDTDILVISDEVYGELTYGEKPHESIAAIDGMWERTVRISGFSKAFAMTGWRIGYVCAPEPIAKQILKLHQYAIMCAPTTAQYAAIEALENGDEDVAAMRSEYDMRRRYILSRLQEIGLSCFEPEGAFYVFPSIREMGLSSEEFCTRLLKEKHVAIVPGNAFGESGEGFVRISYCYSLKHITTALDLIEEFIKGEGKA